MNKIVFEIDKTIVQNNLYVYKKYSTIRLPIKSLQNKTLISLIDLEDCQFVADSSSQIDFLKSLGIDMGLCYFGTPKSFFDFEYAIKNNIEHFVISSKQELNFILQTKKRIKGITLMVNSSSFGINSYDRFGVSSDEFIGVLKLIKEHSILEGLSFHIQGFKKDTKDYMKIYNDLLPVINKYKIPSLNFGGIKVQHLVSIINGFSLKNNIQFIAEPGNSLFNDAISIKANVCYVNHKNKTINLNIGIYSGLLDIALYGNSVQMIAEGNADAVVEYKVFGPSSDSADYLGTYYLPKNIKVGDQIRIHNCGVYALLLNTEFYPCERIITII